MIYFLVEMMLLISVSIIVLFRWRKHPSFAPLFNFKQPFWMAIFISFGMIVFGLSCAELTPLIFSLFHIHYEKLGIQDVTCLAFLFLVALGVFCLGVSCVACIWHLIGAILSYVHTRQPKQTDKS
jgi:hypothetical protein